MKNNKLGISLIVLVITIIVMIILAGAVVITLNNSGIIQKANEAVEATNLAQVRDLAKMLWADAYLDKTIPKDQIEGVVLAKLKEAIGESNFSKYTITVTASGINVEKKKDPAPIITLDSELSEDSTNPTVATGTSYTLTGKVTDEKGIKSLTVNGVAVTVAQDGTWSTTLTLVKDKLTEVTMIATDTSGNTTTKTGYVGYITYTNFTVTSSNRHKVGYDANAESQDLVIPETFYDEEDGKWYKVVAIGGAKAHGAFDACTNISRLIVPNSVTCIGFTAFRGCTSLTAVEFPDSEFTIETLAFYGCTALESVVIPSGCTSIGSQSFMECTNLKSVTLSEGLTSIEQAAFSGCTKLANIEIPDSVTSIGGSAFYNCWDLSSITIPNGVKTLPYGVFMMCYNLETVVLPDGLTKIENRVFLECYKLSSIEIPSTVSSIGAQAFGVCRKLESIAFADGSQLTRLGESAFEGCTGLTSIAIPDRLTSIGKTAFHGCTNLTNVELPSTLTSIDTGAFANCKNLKSVYITDINAWCNVSFADWQATPFGEGKGNLYLNDEKVTNLVIPEGVNSINAYTFAYCTSITSASIPESVTSIGERAFRMCSNLANMTFASNSQLITIGDSALSNCTKLTSIVIPASVTSIEKNAFDGSSALTSVTFASQNGWQVTNDSGATYAPVDVTDTSHAATLIKSTYAGYTWSRRDS